MSALHLRGVVLPEGEERDVWVDDEGYVRDDPVQGADTVLDGGWLLPGLVDAHCHVGLDEHGGVDEATTEAQAVADRDTGALLLRDAGVPVDTHWVDDRPDLPRIIRAGRHIARTRRYIRNYAHEVEPDVAVRVDEPRDDPPLGDQLGRGDRLVGDPPVHDVQVAALAVGQDRATEPERVHGRDPTDPAR